MKKMQPTFSSKIPSTNQENPPEFPPYVRPCPDGLMLTIKVQPRASKTCIEGPLGNALKVRVTAPPVDAAANEAVILLLAEKFKRARNTVSIVRGHTAKIKQIFLRGMDLQTFETHLRNQLHPSR